MITSNFNGQIAVANYNVLPLCGFISFCPFCD